MITLKYWNNLSNNSREKIVSRFMGTSNCVDTLNKEYHHNFDFDATGKTLKAILSSCYLKGNEIEVRCLIKPSFHVEKRSSPIIKKVLKESKKPIPHKYYFRMYTESDPEDGENIWEEAYSENEARDKAYADFHSIVNLDLIKVE